jgi:hypothetical protein
MLVTLCFANRVVHCSGWGRGYATAGFGVGFVVCGMGGLCDEGAWSYTDALFYSIIRVPP